MEICCSHANSAILGYRTAATTSVGAAATHNYLVRQTPAFQHHAETKTIISVLLQNLTEEIKTLLQNRSHLVREQDCREQGVSKFRPASDVSCPVARVRLAD